MLPLLLLTLAAAPPTPATATPHGDRLRDAYFRREASRLAARPVAAPTDALRQQFLDMMGLHPLPSRTDLKATVTGTLDAPAFTVEKLHFQSSPGLYVTGNLYVPKRRDKTCPAVLYVCGHAPVVVAGVPHGNKVAYQHHGALFAENGYVCLVIDTLQLGEVPGLHHGMHRMGMFWWASLGYTPAGVELWNAMRAVDYLASRPEVDATRIGVTGRSGGGATSWWVGAADTRVKAIVPVAGVADLLSHVSEGYSGRLADGVVAGHCDCMYMNNFHRWDYSQVMALCAPRAVLLGNGDIDEIFPVPGYRRPAAKAMKVYESLGVASKFSLLETKGGHTDTPELRLGAFRYMNRHLLGVNTPVAEPKTPRFTPAQLKVFAKSPADAINDVVHERFRKPALIDVPASDAVAREWWPGKAEELRRGLRDRVFRDDAPVPLDAKVAAEVTRDGVRLRAVSFMSEEGYPLTAWVATHESVKEPVEVIATVLREEDWAEWLADLGPAFADVLHVAANPRPVPYPARDEVRFRQLRLTLERKKWAFAFVAPRGVGPTRWSTLSRWDGKPAEQHLLRRFQLLGRTLDDRRIWDTRRAIAALRTLTDAKGPLTLQGTGVMAGIALYAGVLTSEVAALELHGLPPTHRDGPTLLNVLTVLDVPQALMLAAPRKVTVWTKDPTAFAWATRLAGVVGWAGLSVREAKTED